MGTNLIEELAVAKASVYRIPCLVRLVGPLTIIEIVLLDVLGDEIERRPDRLGDTAVAPERASQKLRSVERAAARAEGDLCDLLHPRSLQALR